MLKMRLATLIVATTWLQMSCSAYAEPESFYVVTGPNEAERYYRDMTSLVSQHGLKPNPGTVDNTRGANLYVVEAKGRGVRVWSVNLPLSEAESIACGGPKRPGIDPSQFKVTVSSRSPLGPDHVSTVTSELMASLQAKGYEVRMQPRRCGG
jgi:hypothetical protein